MAREKQNIEFDPSVEEKERSFSFRDLLDGNVLTRKAVLRQSRFLVLLVLIAFLSIANRNHAEKTVIRMNQLQEDVKELRAKSITISSDLSGSAARVKCSGWCNGTSWDWRRTWIHPKN
jgi:hypothetical protein